MEELLRSALTRVTAPPDILERKVRPPSSRVFRVPVLVAAMAALAAFLAWPSEKALDIQPFVQQSPDFVKTVHGESVRHVVLNDVDLFIASPKLHMRGGNSHWIQFPCSRQICLAACKRCTQAALLTAMKDTRLP
jgi:hypothetical protein